MLSRRENLRVLKYGDHAGLAMQKLYVQHDEKGESAKELLNAISELKVSSEAYKAAFVRWQTNLPQNSIKFTATTNSALAIGLGNASPLEVGLSIHHTYGTPYLPGSAIKGLLTRAAKVHNLSSEMTDILFGTTDTAAHIIYWDAMLEPTQKQDQPFQQDVITVHHPKYYEGKGFPTDFDDPNPIPFLSVRPNTKFCVAIASNSEGAGQWLQLAAELLKYALENMGLGGKTNAGYGYFEEIKLPEKVKSEADQGLDLLEQKRTVILQIKAAQDLTKADALINELELIKPEIRRDTLEFLQKQLKSIKQWNLEKPRCQKILSMLEKS